jgi:5-methyltetrahydrofolate--homocysteine methyltransferase
MASEYAARKKTGVEPLMRLSGLEPLNYSPNPQDMRSTFLNVGERCNVAGSIMYKKAIIAGEYEKALSIAASQVGRRGGQVACITDARGMAEMCAAYTPWLTFDWCPLLGIGFAGIPGSRSS